MSYVGLKLMTLINWASQVPLPTFLNPTFVVVFRYIHTCQNATQITPRPDLSLASDRIFHSSQAAPLRSPTKFPASSWCFSALKSSSFHGTHPNLSQFTAFPKLWIINKNNMSSYNTGLIWKPTDIMHVKQVAQCLKLRKCANIRHYYVQEAKDYICYHVLSIKQRTEHITGA